MASVPNYYYNSPWIESAGRNLAAALAPPDPEKQLAVQKDRLTLQMLQEKQRLQAEDRARSDQISTSYANMLEPAINPVTHEVDPVQTEKNVRMDYADALRAGADPKAAAGLLGTASPYFLQQKALADARAAAQLARENAGFSFRRGLQDDSQQFQEGQQQRGFDFRDAQAEKAFQRQTALNAQRQANRLAEIAAKAKATGGHPPKSPPAPTLYAIVDQIDSMQRDSGQSLTPEDYDRMVSESVDEWQRTGNPVGAALSTWARVFPDAGSYQDAQTNSTTVPSAWDFLLPPKKVTHLAPRWADSSPPTLGDAVTPPTMPEEPPAVPPAPAPAPVVAKPPAKPTARKVPSKTVNGKSYPAPTSREQRDSLPAGTEYVAPNGEILTKQ